MVDMGSEKREILREMRVKILEQWALGKHISAIHIKIAGSSSDPTRNVPMQDLPCSTDLWLYLNRAQYLRWSLLDRVQ